jgi:hypothetical protein
MLLKNCLENKSKYDSFIVEPHLLEGNVKCTRSQEGCIRRSSHSTDDIVPCGRQGVIRTVLFEKLDREMLPRRQDSAARPALYCSASFQMPVSSSHARTDSSHEVTKYDAHCRASCSHTCSGEMRVHLTCV